MKARKIAGIRLLNYIEGGINWKYHKDLILDFWIQFKCKDYGYSPHQFDNMTRVVELPTAVQKQYEQWFNQYNFQNDTDDNWISFVDGTLNLLYHTTRPIIEDDKEWYIDLMKSEVAARDICETQVYHGRPNLNAFFRVETNSKTEEVGGRRNGYIFCRRLRDLKPVETKGFYWGVVFQCAETVTLMFDNDGKADKRAICWAANAEHMTLVQVCADGRMKIVPVHVEGKVWRADRYVPEGQVSQNAMTAQAMLTYINEKFQSLYGIWDDIDSAVKTVREQSTARINALNVMNDEEIKVGRVIPNVDSFIRDGNVSDARREYNENVRKAMAKKVKQRDRETKAEVRNIVKAKKRAEKAKHAHYHVTDM